MHIYLLQKTKETPFKTVLGDFEDLLESLEPHLWWNDNDSDLDNFLAMAKSYYSIEVLLVYAESGEVQKWKTCKNDFLKYITEIYGD